MKLFSLLLLIIANHVCLSQSDFNTLYTKARTHYKNKEYPGFTDAIQKAVLVHPYHQGALYYSGVSAALNSKPEDAISYLKKAILIESRYDLKNPDLNSLTERKDFKDLLLLQEAMNARVINSDTAFVIKDRQLHTEGIVYNPFNKSFYLGSIHKRKIIKVDEKGNATDFVKTSGTEMAAIFGLKIDKQNKFLWACSSPIEQMEGFDTTYRSKAFKYDIKDGKIINSYDAPSDVKNSNFGDLIVSNKNEVYVSDSQNGIVLKVNESTKKLDKYFSSPEFVSIQGICFSDDDKHLFIADYVKGIYRLDVSTKHLTKVACDLDVSLKGIDGLLYYKGSLIAIQNGVFPLRSVKLILNKDASAIVDFNTIDRNHPAFNEPTLGTISGDDFYYIANSQWGGYDESQHIKPNDQLQDIVILKTNLNKLK